MLRECALRGLISPWGFRTGQFTCVLLFYTIYLLVATPHDRGGRIRGICPTAGSRKNLCRRKGTYAPAPARGLPIKAQGGRTYVSIQVGYSEI